MVSLLDETVVHRRVPSYKSTQSWNGSIFAMWTDNFEITIFEISEQTGLFGEKILIRKKKAHQNSSQKFENFKCNLHETFEISGKSFLAKENDKIEIYVFFGISSFWSTWQISDLHIWELKIPWKCTRISFFSRKTFDFKRLPFQGYLSHAKVLGCFGKYSTQSFVFCENKSCV